jgi:hypothetical protein
MTTDVVFEGVHTKMRIERPARGVVVLRIEGRDAGELGDAPFRELARDFAEEGAIALYVDARATSGAAMEVSSAWASWLGKHRDRLGHINMLTRSRFVQLTAEFVRKFADLADKMRIYTDEKAFDEALAASVSGAASSSP